MSIKLFIGLDENPNRPGEYSALPVNSILALSFIFSFAGTFTGLNPKLVKTEMFEFDKLLHQKKIKIIFISNNAETEVLASCNRKSNIFVNIKNIPKNSITGIQNAAEVLLGNKVRYFKGQLSDFIKLEDLLNSDKPIPCNSNSADILSQIAFANMASERLISNATKNHRLNRVIRKAKMQEIHAIHTLMLNHISAY